VTLTMSVSHHPASCELADDSDDDNSNLPLLMMIVTMTIVMIGDE